MASLAKGFLRYPVLAIPDLRRKFSGPSGRNPVGIAFRSHRRISPSASTPITKPDPRTAYGVFI
jgi:hypothetical protein